MYKPLALIIMDGVGLSAEKEGNAVMMAKLPNLREISQHYPGAALQSLPFVLILTCRTARKAR